MFEFTKRAIKRVISRNKGSSVPLLSFDFDSLEKANDRIEASMHVDSVRIWRAAGESLQNKQTFVVQRDDGFGLLDMSNSPVLEKALAFAETKYPPELIRQTVVKHSKGNTLLTCPIDLRESENSPVRDLALSHEILAPIARYLGVMPVLANAQVWLSSNDQDNAPIASQLYHFDREDRRQIKCFIPIQDIDEDSGPLTVIKAKYSRAFFDWHAQNGGDASFKQRFQDERVFSFVDRNAEVKMTGKRGHVAMVDTTSCLHFGSRYAQKSKYHLMLQYYSPFSPKAEGKIPSVKSERPEDLVMTLVDNNHIKIKKFDA